MEERSSSGVIALEKEIADLRAPLCEEGDHPWARDASDCLKPFAAFGSFRQRHGDADEHNHLRTVEAPAKLETSACPGAGGASQSFSFERNSCGEDLTDAPVQWPRPMPKASLPVWKYSKKGEFLTTDLEREEAWERKKAQYLPEEGEDSFDEDVEYGADEGFFDALSEHASEGTCSSDTDEDSAHHDDNDDKRSGKYSIEHDNLDNSIHEVLQSHVRKDARRIRSFTKKSFPRASVMPIRTKSLTDEDLEELRGSIDLGFGFSYSEGRNLANTLPALELYYAINKNFVDVQARSSPGSPFEGNGLLRTISSGSTSSPSSETWRISSPGDHPSEVKTRLRHWAQAVACSVKQGY